MQKRLLFSGFTFFEDFLGFRLKTLNPTLKLQAVRHFCSGFQNLQQFYVNNLKQSIVFRLVKSASTIMDVMECTEGLLVPTPPSPEATVDAWLAFSGHLSMSTHTTIICTVCLSHLLRYLYPHSHILIPPLY